MGSYTPMRIGLTFCEIRFSFTDIEHRTVNVCFCYFELNCCINDGASTLLLQLESELEMIGFSGTNESATKGKVSH